ncbi:Golgi-associated plant pathogenesis-related protein 1 [Araneus ventricosus]|uniref:Golgi-associated plant pathogenesis-related protein 1 n=1 Tax=Araneus ventricosus TaxID=182803 RepID=A0A4Y2P1F0_ARAVE|nr:Golgi-associated plant pathogenesis-related protein 1 [Araneus ventricosus]
MNARRNSEDFAQECVRIHNHYRAQHGCPPLHLSYSICAVSQEWANRISTEDHFHHSNHTQYGENLFVIYMSNNSLPLLTAQQVVESWYSEHVFYPFDGHITRDIIPKAGHFTQVIWSGSRELGIGRAISKNNRLYIVANYYPAGNVLRKFAENVPPKIHNYSHMPHYYSRRISSRRIDVDTSTENQHVPQYHRASSRQFGVDSEISTGTLHVPHQYARKVSNRHLDVDTSTGTLHTPHHYTTQISNRQLDTATETLHVPQFYNKRNSSKQFDTNDSSAETLYVPQYYTTRNSSKRLDGNDLIENLQTPYRNNRRASSRQYNFDNSIETLYVPQYYARTASSRRLSINT